MAAERATRIAVDAMGGDAAPQAVLEGVGAVTRTTSIQVTLVGPRAALRDGLRHVAYNAEQVHIVDARDVVGMDESPREAVERKPEASIVVAAREVAAGRADALITAGNTGAAVLACASCFARLPGVRRTAIAAVYPRLTDNPEQDRFALLLDAGATVRCTAEELVQFGLMGAAYAARVSKVPRPAVGLLNIGGEASKGDDVHREAYAQLAASPHIHFVGNVEGHDLPRGKADVIVTDGFTGNVVLKLFEGMGEVAAEVAHFAHGHRATWRAGMFLLRRGLREFISAVDYANYGGAPVLGFERLLIKCHGRSDGRAIANAVKVAAKAVRDDVCGAIAQSLGAHASTAGAA